MRALGTRMVYAAASILVIVLGLGSRRYQEHLPLFLAEYAGDTLWAWMVFLLVSMIAVGRPLGARAAVAAGVALLVELSQLYHAPWIDAVRQTSIGGLALGFGFLWTDLVCYLVGIAMGCAIECMVIRCFWIKKMQSGSS